MAIKINWQDLLKRFINWQEIVRVYKNGGQIRPETVPPVFDDYFYFTAVDAWCERQLRLPYWYGSPWAHFEISTDKENWSDYVMVKGDYYDSPYRWPRITLSNVWDKVYVRNKSTSVQSLDGFRFYVQNWLIWAGWDAWYLLCINSTSTVPSRAFYNLFARCTLLRTPPKLPATIISWYGAYWQMFYWCTSLTTAPALPATTLADSCYYGMFSWCTSLAAAPALPAKNLCQDCYSEMFSWCTSLVDSPTISATTLANRCCRRMFFNCTSLETLPLLASTTLMESCYYEMFKWCTSIVLSPFGWGTPYRIPSTWTGIDAQNALYHMFDNTWWEFIGTPEVNVTYYIWNVIIVPVEHILYDFASAWALWNLPTWRTNSSSTAPAVVSASWVSGAPSSYSLITAPFSFSWYGYVKMVYNFYRDWYYWNNWYTTAFSSFKWSNARGEEVFVYIEEQRNSLIINTHWDEYRPWVSFSAWNYTLTEFIDLNTWYLSATLTNGTDTWWAYSPWLNLQSMLNNWWIYISIWEHCTISSIDVSLFN